MPLHTKLIVAGSWLLLLFGLILYSLRDKGE
jgi:hypothetical protein